MVFEHVEKLKRDYTDKFVVVDGEQPELKRFSGTVGRVKTVNMSGRALVEFPQYANIGWYDIEVDFLKIVDRPKPAPPEKKPAKKAAAKKPAAKKEAGGKPSTADILAAARGGAAAKPAPAAGGKLSTADILAAARTGKGGSGKGESAAAPAKATGKMSLADKLAAARGGAAPAAAEATSTADVLKAARTKKSGDDAPAATKPTGEMTLAEKLAAARGGSAPAPAAEEAPAEEAPVEETAAEEPAAEAAAPAGDLPKAGELSVEEIIAWCREHDAG